MRIRSRTGLLLLLVAMVLAACNSGPVRRVSEPAAAIQQLTVRADGTWDLELRLQNYSSIPMRFDSLDLALAIAGQAAGTVAAAPGLQVGPESADVVTINSAPSTAAKIAVADALAAGRGVRYSLTGTLVATPVDRGSPRTTRVRRESELSPAPGLPGVLR